jgi:hypothetical protein
MKTIQEELGGVSRGRNGGDACKIKTKMGRENAKEFRKELSKCVVNPQAPDFGFKEII